jgi:hypothetical protein
MFDAQLIFYKGLDDAMAARDELCAADFTFEIIDEVDLYSNAVFVTVTHPGSLDLRNEVEAIIDGDILEHGCD